MNQDDESILRGIKCLFLDIDGTLLDISDQDFDRFYFQNLIRHFEDIFSPPEFLRVFNAAVEAMMKHTDYNSPVLTTFVEKFTELTKLSEVEANARMTNFYEEDFPKLKTLVNITDLPIKLIETAQKKGLKVVIATNPVFPKELLKMRLGWIKIENLDQFGFIPHISNFNALKPDHEYYKLLLDIHNCKAEEVLMVGNDFLFDGIASQLGIKTWILNKNQSHVEYQDKFEIAKIGPLEELYELLLNP